MLSFDLNLSAGGNARGNAQRRLQHIAHCSFSHYTTHCYSVAIRGERDRLSWAWVGWLRCLLLDRDRRKLYLVSFNFVGCFW